MASKVIGSKVVLCTDGCANQGVGDLSNSSAAPAFYKGLGETARSKGLVPFLQFFIISFVVNQLS